MVWKSASKCGSCRKYMQMPIMSVSVLPIEKSHLRSLFFNRIRKCGHCFCVPCLRRYFSTALEKQLESVPLLFFFKSDLYDTYKTPQCQEHLDRILDGLRSAGVPPHTIFRYDCPQCHIFVKNAPLSLEVAQKILSGTEKCLAATPDHNAGEAPVLEELDAHGMDGFNSLFFPPSSTRKI